MRHICNLTILRKPKDSQDSLLVLILLEKLPPKTKQNSNRTHGNGEWTITELQAAILNELYVLKIGSQAKPHIDPPLPTVAFHMGV